MSKALTILSRGLPFFVALNSLVAPQVFAQDQGSVTPPQTQEQTAESADLLLHVPSPIWQDQIIYFLMTDRFMDGDPSNNDQGAGEFNPTSGAHYSGGDIAGVIQQLDYIQNLGATAVWTTPINANQWWSTGVNYGGYHGYWATDFSTVDAHNGTLQDYQALSDQLHRRGMYLVQDIVVNHTGNFYNYRDGTYDPLNTETGFYLMEGPDSKQPAPTQPPFDLIDRRNPDHAAAAIYHWTPNISDYKAPEQQFRYLMGSLADLNTSNPAVRGVLKKTYSDWIAKAGVDAFRIDTVRYVEPDFFRDFMHSPDGVNAAAAATGRQDFLTFGEVFDSSQPYKSDGEAALGTYLGTSDNPVLPAVLNFPLYGAFNEIFARGKPTAQLAYRLRAHMQLGNPFINPIFIDNHDTARFLKGGSETGLRQALTTLFTIPGIPVIYQGTEQGHLDARRAMFAGGYGSDRDQFNTSAPLYNFIQRLATLRKAEKALTRGRLSIVAADRKGPGAIVWVREYAGEKILVALNSAAHRTLVSGLKVSDAPYYIRPLLQENMNSEPFDQDGAMTMVLDPGAIYVARILATPTSMGLDAAPKTATAQLTETDSQPIESLGLRISSDIDGKVLTRSRTLFGRAAPSQQFLLVKNGNLDRAQPITADEFGDWQAPLPVADLGRHRHRLQLFDPISKETSKAVQFMTLVGQPLRDYRVGDPLYDDKGPNGQYRPPAQPAQKGQMDIADARIAYSGDLLKLTLTMRELSDDWLPANGFDNVAFSIFASFPDKAGARALPQIGGVMPAGYQWNMGHVVYGWGNYAFAPNAERPTEIGAKYLTAPFVAVDKQKRTITLTYRASDYDALSWQGVSFYVTTWDITGEGDYRHLTQQGSDWDFGGGGSQSPLIMDSLFIPHPN